MTSEKSKACGRRIELLRLHTGELTGPEGDTLRTHVASCARCAGILDALEHERTATLESIDVARESALILARLEAAEAPAPSLGERLVAWLRPAGGAGLLRPALTFALLLLVAVPAVLTLYDPARDPGATTRIKGGAALEMYVKDAQGVRRASDGERLRAGDAIQFRYRAAGKQWLMIVSVTSSGALSPLYPESEGPSIAITPSGTHVLDGSIILDDTKGAERVLALFSDTPLAWADVDTAVKRALTPRGVAALSSVELSRADVEQATILFSKE